MILKHSSTSRTTNLRRKAPAMTTTEPTMIPVDETPTVTPEQVATAVIRFLEDASADADVDLDGIRSFTDLHDVCDANVFIIDAREAFGLPALPDHDNPSDPYGNSFDSAACDLVTAWLTARDDERKAMDADPLVTALTCAYCQKPFLVDNTTLASIAVDADEDPLCEDCGSAPRYVTIVLTVPDRADLVTDLRVAIGNVIDDMLEPLPATGWCPDRDTISDGLARMADLDAAQPWPLVRILDLNP